MGLAGGEGLLFTMTRKIQSLISGLLLVLAIPSAALGQSPKPNDIALVSHSERPRSHSFAGGEELVYIAEFSRLLLKKMDVADFRFSASPQASVQRANVLGASAADVPASSLKLTGDISSRGFFSKLFNLTFRERVESIVEPASFTVQKTKRTDEQGKRVRVSETTYDRGKLFWIERDPNNPARVPRTATVSFTGNVQDVLSAVYYLRTQPLEIGKTFELTLSDSGRVFQLPVRVIEKRRMKTVLGRVEAIRVDPQVYGPDGMLSGKGQFSIWLTNDNRRIPVKARIKLDFGTVDITLRKVTNSSKGLLTKKAS
jgi:hypothetical protein